MKLKKLEKPKKSEETKIETKKDIILKNSLNLNTKPQDPNKFPKNVNEFRHIMDDVNCCRDDIEFMLELRRPLKFKSKEKNSSIAEPQFYQEDLEKYKNKIVKKSEEKKLLKTNIAIFRQIFSNRAKYAINNSVYRYEVSLRTEPNQITKSPATKNEENKKVSNRNKAPWNSTTIPREKTLLDTLLPPVLQPSKEVFSKIENRVGRPVIQIKKEGIIDGKKIYGRIFDYNRTLAKRFPSEHFPGSKYSNDYGIANIGTIRHLLDDDNRTMTSYWSTYLREEKKRKFLQEETKKRERRLRQKSQEKNFAGK
jgi:hypothetical protein